LTLGQCGESDWPYFWLIAMYCKLRWRSRNDDLVQQSWYIFEGGVSDVFFYWRT
jgi:hypothetical protein